MAGRLGAVSRTLTMRLLEGAAAAAFVGLPFGLLLALVAYGWDPLHRLDRRAAEAATAWVRRHPTLLDALDLVAVVFAPRTFYICAGVAALWLFARGIRRVAAWIVVTAAAGSLLGVLTKLAVERARPLIEDPIARAPGFSFPSGHALNSALGCAILLLAFLPLLHGWRRGAACAAALTITLVTGADRVLLGVHYISDVIAGWALAGAMVAGTATAFSLWRREHGWLPSRPQTGMEPEMESELSHSGH